jgi:large subunit ribosomal protein L21
MFAVVRTGGKQYRVAAGDKIVVEKLDGNAGDKVTLADVLLAGDGGNLKSTQGLTVSAEIVAQAKGDKVTVFKKRRRHNYRRKKGHRQQHTILKIVAIGDQKAEKKPATADKAAAPAKSSAKDGAAHAKQKISRPEEGAGDVTGKPTENPAPNNEAQANPPAQSVDAPSKANGKKSAPIKAEASSAGGKAAKAGSTENAAPAKGGSKKAPKK